MDGQTFICNGGQAAVSTQKLFANFFSCRHKYTIKHNSSRVNCYYYVCYSSVVDNDVDLDIALKPETALEDIGVPVTAKMIFHNPNRKKRKGELLEQSTSNGNDPLNKS